MLLIQLLKSVVHAKLLHRSLPAKLLKWLSYLVVPGTKSASTSAKWLGSMFLSWYMTTPGSLILRLCIQLLPKLWFPSWTAYLLPMVFLNSWKLTTVPPSMGMSSHNLLTILVLYSEKSPPYDRRQMAKLKGSWGLLERYFTPLQTGSNKCISFSTTIVSPLIAILVLPKLLLLLDDQSESSYIGL